MHQHSESKTLPYTATQMYGLVADVAAYPKFLPWCAAARIRSHAQQDSFEVMLADLVISFKVFREKFGSRVTLHPAEKRIETEYLDGPFKFLKSEWIFKDIEGGCDVSFHVEFEFKSAILQGVIGVVFNEAMNRIVSAFESRAAELYSA